MTIPTTAPQGLCDYILARFDEFSRSQRDVAQYIVDHLDDVAFQTAEELARRANTSSSTVVRFSQALGFEGYPELQRSARDEYRRRHEPGGGAAELPSGPLFGLDRSPFEDAIAQDHQNLEATARRLARKDVERSVETLVGAERVVVVGVDQMAFFASYLRHLLMLLDLRVEVVTSASQESLQRLARIDERTALVALSAGRPHPLVIRAAKLARHRRARTVALVDATLSEVAQLATTTLFYSSDSPAYVRSHAALLGLLQGLAHGVYSRDSAGFDDRIRAYRLK